MLAKRNDEGKENILYYISRKMVGVEVNYSFMENVCLALVFTVQKLRHYLLSRQITVISKANSLRYILSKPLLSGRLTKWAMLLSPFDIKFMPQMEVKGQLTGNCLAAHPCPDNGELSDNLVDDGIMLIETKSWQLYFDGVARSRGAGVGIVFVTPSGGTIPYSFSQLETCSSNVVECETLIIGLELAIEMHIDQLEVFGDF